jgi:large subunit ribosomal protein L10
MKSEDIKTEKKVSIKKLEMKNRLVELIKNNNTLIISSTKGIPSSKFQSMRHKLKSKATIVVVKKHIMKLAIDEAAKLFMRDKLKELERYLEEGSAVIFSQIDPFELAAILSDEKTPVKAKAGQVALEDIELNAGPTDIPAGPMISELSNEGVKIAIEGGKITIKESKILVKKDEKISEEVANLLAKLEITPFNVGLEPIAAFDTKTQNVYVGIKIDKKATLDSIKEAFSNARTLGIGIDYPTEEIISMIITRVALHEKAIAVLIKNATTNVEQQAQEENEEQK